MADTLRSQYEARVSAFIEESAGLTPFGFAFVENQYQFLTASAERIFTPDLLEDFVDKIREWADGAVGASHVSTPQTRIYLSGCSRKLLRDEVIAPWHYLLSLSRANPQDKRKIGHVKILTSRIPGGDGEKVSVNRVVSSDLNFNELLVHKTENPYSVAPIKVSANLFEGLVFLDGYLW
jgi:hypothetical protein